MRGSTTARGLPRILLTAFALSCAGTLLHARQSPAPQRPPVVRSDQVIKSKVELITSDVIVRQETERSGQRGEQSSATPKANAFAFADLASDLAEVTRAANRANASIYAIDPRGLVADAAIDQPVDTPEWHRHVRTTQDTLRVLAERTGGFALINRNDFGQALRRIDSETSDYYVIGYYSNDPDASKRGRTLEITVRRAGLVVKHRGGAASR